MVSNWPVYFRETYDEQLAARQPSPALENLPPPQPDYKVPPDITNTDSPDEDEVEGEQRDDIIETAEKSVELVGCSLDTYTTFNKGEPTLTWLEKSSFKQV